MPLLPGSLALAAVSAFVGATLYANLVEQPARLSLDDKAMMKEWAPSDRRGFALQAALALIAGLLGIVAYGETHDPSWLVGAVVSLASWPYTYFVVVPLNNRMLQMDDGEDARGLLQSWGLLEWGQTALGLWAAASFIWALA